MNATLVPRFGISNAVYPELSATYKYQAWQPWELLQGEKVS